MISLCTQLIIADSTTATSTRIWCEYGPAGDNAYGGGDDLCNNAVSNSDAEFDCVMNENIQCVTEGNVRCWIESSCECPLQTNPGTTPCTAGYTVYTMVSHTVSWDGDQTDCDCFLGVGNYNIGGIANCCGDDANEFVINEAGVTDGSSNACCNDNNDCVYNNVCYDTTDSTDTGSGVSDQEYCDAGIWEDNDDAEANCIASVGADRWDIDGEAGAGLCCGDDANEFAISEAGATDGGSSDACCTPSTDCVDDDTCYDSNNGAASCHDTGSVASIDEYCDAGIWEDNDDAVANCDACVDTNLFDLGGEIPLGCCGDDPNEYNNSLTSDSATGNIDWPDDLLTDACCDDPGDCVNIASGCIPDGGVSSGFNPGGNDNIAACTPGGSNKWEDCDQNNQRCGDCGLNIIDEGETAGNLPGEYLDGGTDCCGDDSNEFEIAEAGEVIGATQTCCNVWSDCVENDVCYDNQTVRDSDLDSENEICVEGVWTGADGDATLCSIVTNSLGNWSIGFEAGTLASCCGDDTLIEFSRHELGIVDGTDEYECCNAATDCVDDNICYDSNNGVASCRDSDANDDEEYCVNNYWIDQDDNPAYCTSCDIDNAWILGGEFAPFADNTGMETECCGDDANEFRIDEFNSTLNDGGNTELCCNATTDCVDETGCYNDSTSYFNIAELDENGIAIYGTGDLERCENNQWIDADTDQAHCDMVGYGYGANNCYNGTDWTCWRDEGEVTNFGGFNESNLGTQRSCCGDDVGDEFFIMNNNNYACANASDDFVHSDGITAPDSVRRWVAGKFQGLLPNGSLIDLPRVDVKVLNLSSAYPIVNMNLTDDYGFYNISIPAGIYKLSYVKSGFQGATIDIDLTMSQRLNFTIPLTSECLDTCEKYDFAQGGFKCSAGCDNQVGCEYDSLVNTSKFGVEWVMKDLCDGYPSSYKISHNDTHEIQCCNEGYVPIQSTSQSSVDILANIRNADTTFVRTIIYNGKPYSIYLIAFELE